MRVALIGYHSCPFSLLGSEYAGGMSVYLKELCQALSRQGEVSVDLYTRVINPACCGPKRVFPRVEVIHLDDGPPRVLPPSQLIQNYSQFSQKLIDFLQHTGRTYDIIFTHYWLSGLIGYQLKLKKGWPLVHSFHTVAKEKTKNLRRREPSFRSRAEDFITRVAEGIVCHSPEEKAILQRDFDLRSAKIGVVPPGINQELFFPGRTDIYQRELNFSSEDRVLLYVGRLVPEKGLPLLFRALVLLREFQPVLFSRLKVVVIGGGTKREFDQNKSARELVSLVQDLHLERRVFFLGSRPYEKLRNYYCGAEGLILPSYYESFGLVAVEALACGVPVIVPRLGVFPRLITPGKNGLLFQPGEVNDLHAKIVNFLQTRKTFWPPGRISHEITRNLSWEKTARRIFLFLQKINGRRSELKTRFQHDGRPQHRQNLPPLPFP